MTQPFVCQPYKTVKHTQTIRRQKADELFVCVWPFFGLVLKGLIFFHEKMYKLSLTQKRIQNPVKCLRWSKYLVADENT